MGQGQGNFELLDAQSSPGESADEEGKSADEEGNASTGGGDELTCDGMAKHLVGVLHGELGDDSFLKPEDIPKLTQGCEAAGNLETDPNAECLAQAETIEAMDACGKKAIDNLMKPWMK